MIKTTHDALSTARGARRDRTVWFAEPVHEMSLYAEQYEFGLSLLLLEDDVDWRRFGSESEGDTYDRVVPPQQRRDR